MSALPRCTRLSGGFIAGVIIAGCIDIRLAVVLGIGLLAAILVAAVAVPGIERRADAVARARGQARARMAAVADAAEEIACLGALERVRADLTLPLDHLRSAVSVADRFDRRVAAAVDAIGAVTVAGAIVVVAQLHTGIAAVTLTVVGWWFIFSTKRLLFST